MSYSPSDIVLFSEPIFNEFSEIFCAKLPLSEIQYPHEANQIKRKFSFVEIFCKALSRKAAITGSQ